MKKILKIWFVVLVLWAAYRFLFKLPEWVDELLIKPLVFVLLPIGLIRSGTVPGFARYQSVPGFENKKSVFEDIVIGAAVGFVFAFTALIANKLKHGAFLFAPVLPLVGSGIFLYLILSLATSISEEILGRGFLFNLFKKKWSVFLAAVFSSLLFLTLHLPIVFIGLHLTGITLAIFLTSIFLLSMVNCYLYENRGSLVLPILVHIFWNMTIALYL